MSNPLPFLLRITNNTRSVLVAFVVFILLSATSYSYAEDKTFGASIWWAIVTASTVGYGDFYPVTTTGRFIGGLLILSMILLILPLMTAHFASKLIVDRDVFSHTEQEQIKQDLAFIRAHIEAQQGDKEPHGPR